MTHEEVYKALGLHDPLEFAVMVKEGQQVLMRRDAPLGWASAILQNRRGGRTTRLLVDVMVWASENPGHVLLLAPNSLHSRALERDAKRYAAMLGLDPSRFRARTCRAREVRGYGAAQVFLDHGCHEAAVYDPNMAASVEHIEGMG